LIPPLWSFLCLAPHNESDCDEISSVVPNRLRWTRRNRW
jgi:hypothetical protein